MRAPLRIPLGSALALGVALAYGAGFWLVLVHHAEGVHEETEPALLAHWLRDGTLALPGVVAAVLLGAALVPALLDRERRLPARWGAALARTGAALGAAAALAAGNPLHGWLFGAENGHALALGVHLARDGLIALAPALLIAGAVPAFARSRPAITRAASRRRPRTAAASPGPGVVDPASGQVTRRAFVGYGAAGLASAGVAGAVLARSPRPVRAAVSTDRLHMFINEGHVPMVDGTLVYARGYGEAPAGDPEPSLTIGPTVFLAGGTGPIASPHYPLLGADRVPAEGCPAAAGIDTSGTGLHVIRRRHWASFFPRRVIVAETGSEIRLRITNRLREPHTFTIAGVVDETLGPAGSDTAVKDIAFPAPGPGTYVYHDTAQRPVNRVLGLHGVLVVVPAGNPWTLDGTEGEFERQWVWILHDIDPDWARRARMGSAIDAQATPSLPKYFTINDRSGVFAIGHGPDEESNRRVGEDTTPCGHGRSSDVRRFGDPAVGTGQLIRLVNTGIATHQPHFHGNHVWTLASNNRVLPRSHPTINEEGQLFLQHFEDVVEMDPLDRKDVMLPMKPPPDALDEVLADQSCTWVFPMHCHAEMSQTAGGGLYPGGMVSDWKLKP